MRRGTVHLNGGDIVSFTDSGTGEAVVFLHALGRSADDWTHVVGELGSAFRCIAIDFPGHGLSSRPGDYTFERMAQSVRGLIDRLELRSFAMVAHSMGGTVAWILAPELGSRLWALVVEDTAVPVGGGEAMEVPAEPPEPVAHDWEATRRIVAELTDPDPAWAARLSAIGAPVLAIAGGTDDEGLNATLASLSDVEVESIRVGHWVHRDAPDAFIDVTRAFLERHRPGH